MKVLHIGNIANNGFIFSKLLQENGIISCSISPNYGHIMGFPIWEEKKFSLSENQHFSPNISKEELEMFPWFASGSWSQCVAKIELYLDSNMNIESTINIPPIEHAKFPRAKLRIKRYINILRMFTKKKLSVNQQAFISNNIFYYWRKLREFRKLRRITNQFDVIIFYGPSTHYISDRKVKGLNIAMEHGTLREYVFSNYAMAARSKSGYQNADVVLITNQDSLPSAAKLNISLEKVICVPHPNQDSNFPKLRNIRTAKLEEIYSNPCVILPARHTYGNPVDRGKGTEVMLEAVVDLIKVFPNLKFKLIEWGNDVNKSKEFLQFSGVGHNIEWIDLLSRPLLRETMAESFAVIDQMKIQAYGALTADALGIGVPVITAHSCENDIAFFGSCAPVLEATKSEDIVRQISNLMANRALNLVQFEKSVDWYDENMSSKVLLLKTKHLFSKEK